MIKKILVTGGAGFIASHIVDLLLENDYEIMVFDDLSSGHPANLRKSEQAVFVEDICDYLSVDIHFDKFRPDVVVHFAAQPSLLRSVENPQFDADVNINGTLNLLTHALRYDVKKFIFASTSAVYKGGGYLYEDTTPLKPNRPYGISKLAAEMYVRALFGERMWYNFRLANIYGERQVALGENQLIPRALAHIYDGADFKINGDGTQSRDFLYVRDVARAVLYAIKNDFRSGIYNVASGKATTVNVIMNTLKELTGYEGEFEHGEYIQGEPYHVCMPIDKIRKAMKWWPTTKLESGLKKTVKAWQKGR